MRSVFTQPGSFSTFCDPRRTLLVGPITGHRLDFRHFGVVPKCMARVADGVSRTEKRESYNNVLDIIRLIAPETAQVGNLGVHAARQDINAKPQAPLEEVLEPMPAQVL
jgi:hypothetical protein